MVAAVAWLFGLVAAALAVIVLVLGVFALINGFAEQATSAAVGLIGIRGIELVLGLPMILFAALGSLRIIQGTSAPSMTRRQLLSVVVTMLLVGGLGAAFLISALAGEGAPKPSGF